MTTKKNLVLLLLLAMIFPIIITSCNDDDDDLIGLWTRVSDFNGLARGNASSFTIDNYGYLVGGYDGGNEWMNDCWQYDMVRDNWTQCASLPATGRHSGVAFAVNGKGYYGTGSNSKVVDDIDNSKGYRKDFYCYDPTTNQWDIIDEFPGTSRYGAVAFAVGGKGYVGCGNDGNYLKDFFCYDPNTGKWKEITSIRGSKREGASSFVINDVAYIACGENNGDYIYDFWKFDQENETWIELRDIANTSDDDYDDDYTIVRKDAVAFVIDGCAYITCGYNSAIRTDTWKYYPDQDLWENVAKFKGTARTNAVGFSTGTKGYVATGKSSTLRFDDIWTFDPYTYDDDDY